MKRKDLKLIKDAARIAAHDLFMSDEPPIAISVAVEWDGTVSDDELEVLTDKLAEAGSDADVALYEVRGLFESEVVRIMKRACERLTENAHDDRSTDIQEVLFTDIEAILEDIE